VAQRGRVRPLAGLVRNRGLSYNTRPHHRPGTPSEGAGKDRCAGARRGVPRSWRRHLAGCAARRNEEHGLRETHERLAGVSIAVSSTPPDLKARILGALPQRGGGREATSAETVRDGRALLSPVRRAVATAVLLLLLFTGLAEAYWAGDDGRAHADGARAWGGRRTRGNGFGFRCRGEPGSPGACRRLGPASTTSCGSARRAGVSAPAFSWWTTGDGVSSPLRPQSWVAATSAPASHQSSSQKSRASTPPG
jgi:hypothetical protein